MSKPPERPVTPPAGTRASGPRGPKTPTPARGVTPPAGGPRQAEMERALALRDVMEHAVKVHQETGRRARPRGSLGRTGILLGVTLPLLAFSIWSYVTEPEFLWGPAPVLEGAEQASHLKVAMYYLARRVEASRAQAGHYPATLTEVGDSVPGVTYHLLSDSAFELRAAAVPSAPIVFRSGQPVEQFLGSSAALLPRRPR